MTISIKGVAVLSLACIAVDVFAAFVPESDVRKAAEAFVATDAIGSSVLSGRSVVGVSKRDGLWIVALAPSGHVIFSGSDLVEPVVGFSKNDFVEPDPESPAFAVLEGANASVATAEAQDGGTRHARWTKLLGDVKKSGLLRADNPSSGAVVVEPFLADHYDQCQPYNDYAPVYEPDENCFESGYESYRGRCPCGCVATAAAQVFHHFKWPARIDSTNSCNHVFVDEAGSENPFSIRLDGHMPVGWDAISTSYPYYCSKSVTNYYPNGAYTVQNVSSYDLRGVVAEAVRYPIARLILWCDVMANMSFEKSGSSANYDDIARNVSDWYTSGHWVEVGANADYSQVVSDLRAGIPLQVGLDGHQVVAHGWAQDGTYKYIYLNYGWGGGDYGNDGYYNLNNSSIDDQIQEIFVGHYPRAKPQIDPLPRVCDTNLTLRWHFPNLHADALTGFTVYVQAPSITATTFTDDFSATKGISDAVNGSSFGSYDKLLVKTDATYGSGKGNLLYAEPLAVGHFTFYDELYITESSTLSFVIYSRSASGCTYEIQASFDNGEWETLLQPGLTTGTTGSWKTHTVDLGGHDGEIARFRIFKGRNSNSYNSSGRILLDNFTISNVRVQDIVEQLPAAAEDRSCNISGLAPGKRYSFAVVPLLDSTSLVAGEKSDSIATTTAGEILVPVEGEVTYVNINSAFPTSDDGVQWTMVGTLSGNKVTKTGAGTCSVSAQLIGTLTEDSQLTFNWQGRGTYKSGVRDILKVSYVDENNNTTVLIQKTNSTAMAATAWNQLDVSLGGYSGQRGTVKIELSCPTTKTSSTLTISQPQIKDISVPSGPPEITWVPQQISALGMPEIRSVSSVSEGFYGECGTNTSAFTVICSSSVESLEARPSHLSLVRDEDVTVTKTGSGTFNVSITPSGVNEGNLRSRMILTLVGTDANGTKCYKDLSLRFSEVAQVISDVVVSASTSGGESYSVMVPYSWLEEKGLVASGSDAAAHESALAPDADADSDGLPNWAEYVCGTDPSDADDKLTVSITMVGGEPVVTYTPDDGRIASGFKAVIKGTSDLAAAFSTWEIVTETRTSTCRFFRVEIVPEN